MGISERKEREKAQKRELLIDAAEKIFFEKGYENATMDEIAEVAEYSKGTLYLYFTNKEELYIAIASRSMDIFSDIFKEELSRCKTGAEKLNAIKLTYLRFFREHPKHMQAMLYSKRSSALMQSLHEDEKTLQDLMEKDRAFQKEIASAIQESIDDKSIENWAEMSEKDIMALVFGGAILLNGIFENIFDFQDHWEEHINIPSEDIIAAAYSLLKF